MATIPTGRFVWFEYVTKDAAALDKAKRFFGELFHWKTQATGGYEMIAVGDKTIGSYLPTTEAPNKPAHWISHLQVDNIDDAVAKLQKAGGKVRAPARKVGDFGTMAIVADPFDVTFALWQPARVQGSGDFLDTPNTWCWNELTVPDPDKAVAFYKAIGGFEDKRMEMGPGATYHVLETDGKGRAGIVKPMKAGQPSMWLPYVHVGSADETHDRAKRLGAQVFVAPTDIPDVGRFAVLADPNGAAFAVMQPKR